MKKKKIKKGKEREKSVMVQTRKNEESFIQLSR